MNFQRVQRMVKEHDTDGSGDLNVKELRAFLETHLHGKQGVLRLHKPPTEEEIGWIIEVVKGSDQESIDATEIHLACELWRSFLENRYHIEAVFCMYNSTKTKRFQVFSSLLFKHVSREWLRHLKSHFRLEICS